MTVNKILYPTDFSDGNHPVLRLAESLARVHDAELLIAHVFEPPVETMVMSGAATAVVGPSRAEQEKVLCDVRPADPVVRVKHEIVSGTASDGILKLAEDQSVDLIVMGTHGRQLLSRLLMGSVAEEVMRHASCPVITLKLGEQAALAQKIKKILLPTDFSKNSQQAVGFAASLARDFGAELQLLYVERSIYALGAGSMDYPAVEQGLVNAQTELDKIPLPSDIACSRHVESGDPASTIDEFTREHDIDLIVMTTHGRTGLARLLLGSVAEAVVRRGTVPVLTLRTELAAAE